MPGRRGYIWKGGGQAGCFGPIFHARYHFISEWEDLDREIRIGKYLKSEIEVNLVWGIDKRIANLVFLFPLKVNIFVLHTVGFLSSDRICIFVRSKQRIFRAKSAKNETRK